MRDAFKYFYASSGTLEIRDAAGAPLNPEDFISTGCTVNLVKDGAVTVSRCLVIAGDTDGSGFISSGDYVAVKAHLKDITALEGAWLLAADVNNDGFVSSADYILLKAHLRGIVSVYG